MAKKRIVVLMVICIFSVLFLSVLSSKAHAQYKEMMHDEWHRHNDNFTMDNKFYKIKAGGTPTKVIISIDNEVIVVENGTCIDKLNMSICLKEVNLPEVELHRIYQPEDYEYNVEIWYYLAKLAIDKIIEKTEFLVGEQVRVAITLKNDGSLPARGIYFRDIYFSASYPDFFVTNVIGCSFDKHNVTWQGILKPTQTKECVYYLEAVKETSFSSIAKATYLVGILNKTRSISSDMITLTVPKFDLDFKKHLNSTSVMVGDEFEYNFTMENNLEDIRFDNVALTMHIPEGIEPLEYSDSLSTAGNLIRWSGPINSNETKDFWIKFRAKHGGINTIKTNVNYNVDHIVRFFDWFDNVTGKIDKLAIQKISLPRNAAPGQTAQFVVNINNPSDRYVFKKVRGNITTNLPLSLNPFSFDEIGKKRFRNIITRNFTLPVVDDITHYKLNFDVEYETEYGQIVHLSEANTVTVSPKRKEEGKKDISPTRAKIIEDIEKIGVEKFTVGFVIFAVLFFLSSTYYIRKMVKKVREYEQYEK